jgi:hypothetical protein
MRLKLIKLKNMKNQIIKSGKGKMTIAGLFLVMFIPGFATAASTLPARQTPTSIYYSASPESHSAKMNAYIHFMHAVHDGDAKTANEVATDDITWDLNAGSETPNGLPWIGLFKGKKEIFQAAQSINRLELEVLSRQYYLILETKTQLIMVAKDTIKLKGMVIPNIGFANVITFRGDKIAYIKSVEDSARVLTAYQAYQAGKAVEAWSK